MANEGWKKEGINFEYKVEGDYLIMRVDLTKNHGPSKSGKTITVGTSSGNKTVEGYKEIRKMGVNVYRYEE
jgi:hypothetical protein